MVGSLGQRTIKYISRILFKLLWTLLPLTEYSHVMWYFMAIVMYPYNKDLIVRSTPDQMSFLKIIRGVFKHLKLQVGISFQSIVLWIFNIVLRDVALACVDYKTFLFSHFKLNRNAYHCIVFNVEFSIHPYFHCRWKRKKVIPSNPSARIKVSIISWHEIINLSPIPMDHTQIRKTLW